MNGKFVKIFAIFFIISIVLLILIQQLSGSSFEEELPTSSLTPSPSIETGSIDPEEYGEECELAGECGEIMRINCRAEVDGPLYYVDKNSGEILEYCGGYCFGPDDGVYCQNCPPVDWDCD